MNKIEIWTAFTMNVSYVHMAMKEKTLRQQWYLFEK